MDIINVHVITSNSTNNSASPWKPSSHVPLNHHLCLLSKGNCHLDFQQYTLDLPVFEFYINGSGGMYSFVSVFYKNQCLWDSTILFNIEIVHSFSLLSVIPLYKYILNFIVGQFGSLSFGLLRIMLLLSLSVHAFSVCVCTFLLGIQLGVDLLA